MNIFIYLDFDDTMRVFICSRLHMSEQVLANFLVFVGVSADEHIHNFHNFIDTFLMRVWIGVGHQWFLRMIMALYPRRLVIHCSRCCCQCAIQAVHKLLVRFCVSILHVNDAFPKVVQNIGFCDQIFLVRILSQMRYSIQFVTIQSIDHFKIEFFEIVVDVRLEQAEELLVCQQFSNYFRQFLAILFDFVRILMAERLRKLEILEY